MMSGILVAALGALFNTATEIWGYARAVTIVFIISSDLQSETGSCAIGKGWEKDGRQAGYQRCVEGRGPPTEAAARLLSHRLVSLTAVKAASSYPAVACTRTGRSRPSYSSVSGDYRCAIPNSSASCLYRPKVPRSRPWPGAYTRKCDRRLTASVAVTTHSRKIAFNRPGRSRPQMLPGPSFAA